MPDPAPRRRARRGWIAFIAVVLLIWGGLTALSLLSARESLLAAVARLGGLQADIEQTEVEGLRDQLAIAKSELADARGDLSRPWVQLALRAPLVGRDLRTVDALATGADDIVSATDTLLAVVDAPDDGQRDIAALVTEVRAPLAQLRETVQVAGVDVAEQGPRIGALVDARTDFVDISQRLLDQLRTAEDFAVVGEWLVDTDGEQLLVGAITPAELQGGGGFLGSIATAEVADGDFEIGAFRTVSTLPTPDIEQMQVPNPSWAARYTRYGGLFTWQNYLLSPDLPAAADVVEQAWAATLDDTPVPRGSVYVDPFALQLIVESTGPLQIDESTTLNADEVAQFLLVDAYGQFGGSVRRQAILGQVAAQAFGDFVDRSLADPLGSVDVISDLLDRGHVRLHARDGEVQAAIERLGIGGGIRRGEATDTAIIAVNNGVATKVDTFLRSSAALSVTRDGSRSLAELVVDIENTAPTSGLEPYVIGPAAPGRAAGETDHLWSLFCGACEFVSTAVEPSVDVTLSNESGSTIADSWIPLQATERARIAHSWEQSSGWETGADGTLRYTLHWRPVPGREPTSLVLNVNPGDGWIPVEVPQGAVSGPNGQTELTWRQPGDELLTFVFETGKSGERS